MKQYYLVIHGNCKPYSIFKSWEACEKKVKGFSGAKYKGFESMEELNAYLTSNPKEKPVIPKKETEKKHKAIKEIQAETSGSFGEANVEYILKSYGLKYRPQHEVIINGYPHLFDFAILNGKRIAAFIEYDGAQHFEAVGKFGGTKALQNRKFRDAIKDSYCQERGIKMVRISYKDSYRAEAIIKSEILPLLKKYTDPYYKPKPSGKPRAITYKELSEIIGWQVDYKLLGSWSNKEKLDRRKSEVKLDITSVTRSGKGFLVEVGKTTYLIKK